MCELSGPTGLASTGCPARVAPIQSQVETCATVSKITRHQSGSTHDLSSLFAHSWSNRRRVSCCGRCAWVDETGLRASRKAVSALSRCRSCVAHHLPRLDLLVGRHHPDG